VSPVLLMVIGECVRRSGFWLQLVFLALVDWGSVYAFQRQQTSWHHWAGLTLVNAVLLAASYVMWRWLRSQRDPGDLASRDYRG
jgi:hypothetical protein